MTKAEEEIKAVAKVARGLEPRYDLVIQHRAGQIWVDYVVGDQEEEERNRIDDEIFNKRKTDDKLMKAFPKLRINVTTSAASFGDYKKLPDGIRYRVW